MTNKRRCRCFPCRLPQRPMVATLYRRSTKHAYIQLAIRLRAPNKRHQKDHTSIPRRPMGLHLTLGVSLHLAPRLHRREEKVARSKMARCLRPRRQNRRSHPHQREILLRQRRDNDRQCLQARSLVRQRRRHRHGHLRQRQQSHLLWHPRRRQTTVGVVLLPEHG